MHLIVVQQKTKRGSLCFVLSPDSSENAAPKQGIQTDVPPCRDLACWDQQLKELLYLLYLL